MHPYPRQLLNPADLNFSLFFFLTLSYVSLIITSKKFLNVAMPLQYEKTIQTSHASNTDTSSAGKPFYLLQLALLVISNRQTRIKVRQKISLFSSLQQQKREKIHFSLPNLSLQQYSQSSKFTCSKNCFFNSLPLKHTLKYKKRRNKSKKKP